MDCDDPVKLGGFGRFSSWVGVFRDEIALAHRRLPRPKTVHAVCIFLQIALQNAKKTAFRFK